MHANNMAVDWSVGSLLQKPSLTHKKIAKQVEQEYLRHESRDDAEHIFSRKLVSYFFPTNLIKTA